MRFWAKSPKLVFSTALKEKTEGRILSILLLSARGGLLLHLGTYAGIM